MQWDGHVVRYKSTDGGTTYNTSGIFDDAITTISRNGTTFTATRVNGSTFTFDQQDNNTDIHGYQVVVYDINNLNSAYTNTNAEFAAKFIKYGGMVIAHGSMKTGSNITNNVNIQVFSLPWAAHEQFEFLWAKQSDTSILNGYCNIPNIFTRVQFQVNQWYQFAFSYITDV